LFQEFKIISVRLCVALSVDKQASQICENIRGGSVSVIRANSFRAMQRAQVGSTLIHGQYLLRDQRSYESSVSETRLGGCLVDSTTCSLAEIYRRFRGL